MLETKVTKKWKCEKAGEKSCFVVLKLDKPYEITGIDIGNEKSAFIEVLVANSKQDPPQFKEILLATSFQTLIEAKNDVCPNRVRMFTSNVMVESVSKKEWDLVKFVCTQPFNNKVKYGISFITLHTTGPVENGSPAKPVTNQKQESDKSSSKEKKNFGKFTIRASTSDSDDASKKEKESPFARWKAGKSGDKSSSLKEAVKTKMEEGRKRIRMLTDSSDEDAPPAKPKPNRNRTAGLLYVDDDDAPNERLQKKIDKDKEAKAKDQKTPNASHKRERSPLRSDSKKSKFSSFIDNDVPSTSSSSHHKSPHKSSRSSSSHSSSRDKKSSDHKKDHKSPHKDKDKDRKSSHSHHNDKKSSPPKNVSYKPFNQLLQGVVFVFSGYQNPERGILRQKALDMGGKYKSDWDSSCTHLICAFSRTPKHTQVKGKGKIVTKKWIEACFSEQKKLPWRRYALDNDDKDEPESEEEIHNALSKPKTPVKTENVVDSDDDMMIVDNRGKNGDKAKSEDVPKDPMDVSTDDDLAITTKSENDVFDGFSFFLNESDLAVTTIIKLKDKITSMMGKVCSDLVAADFIISEKGKGLHDVKHPSKVLSPRWVEECYELGAIIPRSRYQVIS